MFKKLYKNRMLFFYDLAKAYSCKWCIVTVMAGNKRR